MKNYEKLLKKWSFLKPIHWQKEALNNQDLYTKPKAVVAAGTSSGKTYYMIMRLILQYWNKSFKGKITLVIPAYQTALRTNFVDALMDFVNVAKVPFTFKVCKGKEDVKKAIEDKVEVIICLPTSVEKSSNLPKIEQIFIDEAHGWYFATTIKKIIKRTKPEQQVLLTGTPFKFNLRKAFYKFWVPVMDLFKQGLISNVETHIISSSYDFKNSDYNALHEVKTSKNLANKKSLEKVLLGMIRKLRNPIKAHYNVNRITSEAVGRLFKYLDKTVIWCKSIEQAEFFTKTLRSYKGLENSVLISHSKCDPTSEMLYKFTQKENEDIKILVVVDRTKLGWSFKELFNGIDFTLSRNPATIIQMMARLFRLSENKPNKVKYFYKVSNSNDAGYYTVIMKAVLLLLDRNWYSIFDGKNFNDMRIPVTVPRRRVYNNDGSKRAGRKKTKINFEMIDLPLDMNFFKTVLSKQDDMFSTVAWTTLSKVRTALTGYNNHRVSLTVEEATKIMKNYKTYKEFREKEKQTYEWFSTNNLRKVCMDYFNSYKLTREEMIEEAKQATLKWVKKYGKNNTTEFTKKESKNYGRLMRLGYRDWLREQMNFRGHRKIKVYKVTAKGNYGKSIYVDTYKNYKEVVSKTGVAKVYIDLVLSGTYKTAKGYTFKYV